jgi:hypothetical protein
VRANWDVADADARVGRLRAAFTAAVKKLEALLPEVPPKPGRASALPPAAELAEAMHRLASLGLRGAVPSAGEGGLELLLGEARAVARRGRHRLRALAKLEEAWQRADDAPQAQPKGDPEVRVRRARQRWRALVGKGLPLLPRFKCDSSRALSDAFARSDELLNGDAGAATAWLQKLAKVREGVARLDDVLTTSELTLDHAAYSAKVAQLPDQDVWVATAAPADRRKGYLNVWALDHGGLEALDAGAALAGLVFDSWLEQIPAPDVVTGVAVHFDAPSSRAPQSLLLAVPPQGEPWSFELVVDILMETLEAARLRAVDPDVLDAHGHHLPAIYAPRRLDAGAQPEGDTHG